MEEIYFGIDGQILIHVDRAESKRISHNIYHRRYRADKREEIAANQRSYRSANPEKFKEYRRKQKAVSRLVNLQRIAAVSS